jgi:general secretion pathway protein N
VRRFLILAIAALFVFLVLMLARFPARWAAGWLPQGVLCGQLSGTLWNGRCAELTIREAQLGDVRWNVRASRLLAGRLAALVLLAKPGVDVRGEFETGLSGELTGSDLTAVIALDRSILADLPPNLRGSLRADLARLHVRRGVVADIAGRIEALELAQVGNAGRLELGDYAVTFPGGNTASEPVGALEDLRGPLDVSGSLRLTAEPGWILEGSVAARPEAPPQLVRQLQYLGPPDAAGRRPFSLAGTY